MIGMKKKRVIKLKNPKLRKIRKNLRELLLNVFSEKLSEILDEKGKIRENQAVSNNEKVKKLRDLSREIQNLELAKRKAPLSCSTCKRIDIDLVYNPVYNTWYCEDCYEFNAKGEPDNYP